MPTESKPTESKPCADEITLGGTLHSGHNLAESKYGRTSCWDTSKVTNMYGTFYNAKAFNSEVVWDTSKGTNMRETFYRADAFNSERAWDTSSVTNMYRTCLLYTSPSPRDGLLSRMPSSA